MTATILIAIAIIALMMGGLGIKMLMGRSKEFKRPCTNADPKTGKCAHCTCDKKDSCQGREDENTKRQA